MRYPSRFSIEAAFFLVSGYSMPHFELCQWACFDLKLGWRSNLLFNFGQPGRFRTGFNFLGVSNEKTVYDGCRFTFGGNTFT